MMSWTTNMKPNSKSKTRRTFSRVAAGLLVLGLSTAAPSPPAYAQEDAGAAEGESKGRPLDGYFGTGILAFGALFLIGKSARR